MERCVGAAVPIALPARGTPTGDPQEIGWHGYTPQVITPLLPYACFSCRRCFKRPGDRESAPCPECGGSTIRLGEKFKAPSRKDLKAWRVVEFVVSHGFRYEAIWKREEGGSAPSYTWDFNAYPTTMAEAAEFVAKYDPSEQADRRWRR